MYPGNSADKSYMWRVEPRPVKAAQRRPGYRILTPILASQYWSWNRTSIMGELIQGPGIQVSATGWWCSVKGGQALFAKRAWPWAIWQRGSPAAGKLTHPSSLVVPFPCCKPTYSLQQGDQIEHFICWLLCGLVGSCFKWKGSNKSHRITFVGNLGDQFTKVEITDCMTLGSSEFKFFISTVAKS